MESSWAARVAFVFMRGCLGLIGPVSCGFVLVLVLRRFLTGWRPWLEGPGLQLFGVGVGTGGCEELSWEGAGVRTPVWESRRSVEIDWSAPIAFSCTCGSGSKTIQMKPTRRPAEHSCRKAIVSQNSASVRTLFHSPLAPLSFELGISSSSSSKNRALGSSGNRGTRHRGGTVVMYLVMDWRGCPTVQWLLVAGGKYSLTS